MTTDNKETRDKATTWVDSQVMTPGTGRTPAEYVYMTRIIDGIGYRIDKTGRTYNIGRCHKDPATGGAILEKQGRDICSEPLSLATGQ